jgi:DNA primase
LRQQRGDNAIAEMLESKRPLFEFVIRHRISNFNLNDIGSRVAAARMGAEVVADLTDPALQSAYTRFLADIVSLEVSEVAQVVAQVKGAAKEAAVSRLRLPANPPSSATTIASEQGGRSASVSTTDSAGWKTNGANADDEIDRKELRLLEVVVQQSQHAPLAVVRRISAAGLQSTAMQSILDFCSRAASYGDTESLFADLTREFGDPFKGLLLRLLTAELPVLGDEEIPKYCSGVLNSSLLAAMNREKSDLLQVLKRLDPASQSHELQLVQQQLVELEQERRKLIG